MLDFPQFMLNIKYTFNGRTPFFKNLKEQVDQHFATRNLHPAGNGKLYWKSAVQILFATGLYVLLVFFTPGTFLSLGLCILLGLNLSAIGFNIMHEGGHQSFSRYAWMNRMSAYVLNLLGGNSYYWKIKHNINHHSFTNIEGMDSDIDVKPFMRLHQGQPLHAYHRYQHIYWVALYGISYLAWVFYEDFNKYLSKKVSVNSAKEKLPLKEHLIFWISKVWYIVAYIVVPILFVGWLPWLIGFLIVAFVCGLTISIVFQLAHVVEGTQFHEINRGEGNVEWAVHQINSTANFANSSKVLHWLLGGLNFQIEHHLFPRISHIHYRDISLFVRKACREYNIVYHEYNSMTKAIASHLSLLYKMGRACMKQQ